MHDALWFATLTTAAIAFAAVVVLFPIADSIAAFFSAVFDWLGGVVRSLTRGRPGTGGGDYFESSKTGWRQFFGIEAPPSAALASGGYLVYGRFLFWAALLAVLTVAPELQRWLLPDVWDSVKKLATVLSYTSLVAALFFVMAVFSTARMDEEDALTRVPARMRRVAESRVRAMANDDLNENYQPYFRIRYAAGVAMVVTFSMLALNAVERDFDIYPDPIVAWQYAKDVVSSLMRGVPIIGERLRDAVAGLFEQIPGVLPSKQADNSEPLSWILQVAGLTLAVLGIAIFLALRRFAVDVGDRLALVRLEKAIKSADNGAYADKVGRVQELEGALDRATDSLKTVKIEQPNNRDDIKKHELQIAALKKAIAAAKTDLSAQSQAAQERRFDIDEIVDACRDIIGAGSDATMDGIARIEVLLQNHKADRDIPAVLLRHMRQAGFVNKSALALGLLSAARGVPRLQHRSHATLIHSLSGAIHSIVGDEWPPIVIALQGTPSTAGIDKEALLKQLRQFCDTTTPASAPAHWAAFTDLLAVILSELPQSHWGVEAEEAIERLQEAIRVVTDNIVGWWGRSPDLAIVHHNLGMARLVVARQCAIAGRAADHILYAREAVTSFKSALDLREPVRGVAPGVIYAGRNTGAQGRAMLAATLNGFGHACAMLTRATLNNQWGRDAMRAFEDALEEWDTLRKEMAGDPMFVVQNVAATQVHLASVAASLGMFRIAEQYYHNAASTGGGLQPIHAFNANVRRVFCLIQGGVAAAAGWLDDTADNAPGRASGRLRQSQAYFAAAFKQIEKIEAQYVKSAQSPVRRPRLFLDGARPPMAMLFLAKGLAYSTSCQAYAAKAPEFLILGARLIDYGLRFDLSTQLAGGDSAWADAKAIGETWLKVTRSHLSELETLSAKPQAGLSKADHEKAKVFLDLGGPSDVALKQPGES